VLSVPVKLRLFIGSPGPVGAGQALRMVWLHGLAIRADDHRLTGDWQCAPRPKLGPFGEEWGLAHMETGSLLRSGSERKPSDALLKLDRGRHSVLGTMIPGFFYEGQRPSSKFVQLLYRCILFHSVGAMA